MYKIGKFDLADNLFSKAIRARDKKCIKCGSTRSLTCAHIISRRYRATRWLEKNAITLCLTCHRYYTDNPREWKLYIDGLFGEGYYDTLKVLSKKISKQDPALIVALYRA